MVLEGLKTDCFDPFRPPSTPSRGSDLRVDRWVRSLGFSSRSIWLDLPTRQNLQYALGLVLEMKRPNGLTFA